MGKTILHWLGGNLSHESGVHIFCMVGGAGFRLRVREIFFGGKKVLREQHWEISESW